MSMCVREGESLGTKLLVCINKSQHALAESLKVISNLWEPGDSEEY